MKSARAIVVQYISTQNFPVFWKKVMEEWPSFSKPERMDIFSFLYNQQQYRTLVALAIHDLSMDEPNMPWLYYFKILTRYNLKIPKPQIQSLQDYFSILGISTQETQSPAEICKSILAKIFSDFDGHVLNNKNELLSGFKIAQAEQLEEQQKTYLLKLQKMFPMDQKVNKSVQGEAAKTANSNIEAALEIKPSRPQVDTKEQEMTLAFTEKFCSNLSTKQDFLDFSVLLHQFGFTKVATKILRKAPEGCEKYYYLLDFLFTSEQYVSLIGVCEKLKTTELYSQTKLNKLTIYYLARAYWNLGERSLAIEQLLSLKRMDSKFKNTLTLLDAWQEGVH